MSRVVFWDGRCGKQLASDFGTPSLADVFANIGPVRECLFAIIADSSTGCFCSRLSVLSCPVDMNIFSHYSSAAIVAGAPISGSFGTRNRVVNGFVVPKSIAPACQAFEADVTDEL